MKKILLIEDENNLRTSLESHLKFEGFEVESASSAGEAQKKVPSGADLILLDWMLPDGRGIDLLRKWRSQGIDIPIILLTARAEIIDKITALELGANDYVTKPFEPRELVARIRVWFREKKILERENLEGSGISLSLTTRRATYCGEAVPLRKMEFALLKTFLERPGQVFSREELLEQVWGYEAFPTTRTIDNHILQLRQKFSADLFETVRGFGYRYREKNT